MVFINYCVFSKILRYILNSGFPCCQCVYIELHAEPLDGRSIATELAELRKITRFWGKNTIFTEHPVVIGFQNLENFSKLGKDLFFKSEFDYLTLLFELKASRIVSNSGNSNCVGSMVV